MVCVVENKNLEKCRKWLHMYGKKQCRLPLWALLRKTTHTFGLKKAIILGANRKWSQNSHTRTWERILPNEAVRKTVHSNAKSSNFNFGWLFLEAYWSGSAVTDCTTTPQTRRNGTSVRCERKWCLNHGLGSWCLKISRVAMASGSRKSYQTQFSHVPPGASVYLVEWF